MNTDAQSSDSKRIRAVDVLAVAAAERKVSALPYAGEVSVQEAFDYLQSYGDGVLVDVRTVPEWQFVGEADLAATPSRSLKISWKTYPAFTLNPEFADQLEKEGPDTQTPLFFLCRSGGRSLDAANYMAQKGYRYCFNVTDGFEGEPNSGGHRGTTGGWKAAGLPWRQG